MDKYRRGDTSLVTALARKDFGAVVVTTSESAMHAIMKTANAILDSINFQIMENNSFTPFISDQIPL